MVDPFHTSSPTGVVMPAPFDPQIGKDAQNALLHRFGRLFEAPISEVRSVLEEKSQDGPEALVHYLEQSVDDAVNRELDVQEATKRIVVLALGLASCHLPDLSANGLTSRKLSDVYDSLMNTGSYSFGISTPGIGYRYFQSILAIDYALTMCK